MKKEHILYFIIILLVGYTIFNLYNESIGELKSEIKVIEAENTELTNINEKLFDRVKTDSIILVKGKLKIDSLIASDSINQKQFKIIQWRYAKLKKDYAGLSDSDKWDEFGKLIIE